MRVRLHSSEEVHHNTKDQHFAELVAQSEASRSVADIVDLLKDEDKIIRVKKNYGN